MAIYKIVKMSHDEQDWAIKEKDWASKEQDWASKEQDYACNKQELIALGQAFAPNQTDLEGAHRKGANLFKISFPELQKLFREEHKWLSKNCLVAVAGSLNDGTAGLQEDASFAPSDKKSSGSPTLFLRVLRHNANPGWERPRRRVGKLSKRSTRR